MADRPRFFYATFVDPMLTEAAAIGIPATEIIAYIIESAGADEETAPARPIGGPPSTYRRARPSDNLL
ncbi:hypothetical protein [Amycolatopsis minnesotensis]|uniref:Uncharacterized protein n=1 Tax=Amycolatopsis minnesotensis TaxID=337894 RepID=A0ABN2PWV4_9PSEU